MEEPRWKKHILDALCHGNHLFESGQNVYQQSGTLSMLLCVLCGGVVDATISMYLQSMIKRTIFTKSSLVLQHFDKSKNK